MDASRRFPSPRWTLCISAVLLFAAVLASGARYASNRARSIAWIRSTGGELEFVNSNLSRELPDRRYDWLRTVRFIRVRGNQAGDLAHLGCLRELRFLDLTAARVDEEALRNIGRMSKLQVLYFSDGESAVTDSSMRWLRGCRQLEELRIYAAPITDRGVEHLRGLPLIKLGVGQTRITDSGLAAFSGMPLRELDVSTTAVSDAGLLELAGARLELLSLSGTQVTDQGLVRLSGMPLNWLSLYGTQIGDEGVAALKRLPLKYLDLRQTRVTPAGLAHLSGMKSLQQLELSSPPMSSATVAAALPAGVQTRFTPAHSPAVSAGQSN